MGGPWAESVADHEVFARDGQGDALRRLLRRHGPLLLGLLASESGERPEARLTRVVSDFVARRFRGAPEQWLPQLLQALVSASPADANTEADGRRALWLAGRDEGAALAFANPEVVRAAIDKHHVSPQTPVKGAREIAFFPPMTGG
jgi:molybdopterin synthase sulfur carrier subunit